MQAQENDGTYRKPKMLKQEVLDELLQDKDVKRVLVFSAYDESGKPTKELRRAWRRYSRTRRR